MSVPHAILRRQRAGQRLSSAQMPGPSCLHTFAGAVPSTWNAPPPPWRPPPTHRSAVAWPQPKPLTETSAVRTLPTLSPLTHAHDHTFPGAVDPSGPVLPPQAISPLHSRSFCKAQPGELSVNE